MKCGRLTFDRSAATRSVEIRTQRAAAADPARRGRNILPICGNTHPYHIANPPIATIAYLMNGSQPFQQLTVSRRGTRGGAFMRLRQAAGSRTAENDPKSRGITPDAAAAEPVGGGIEIRA